MASGHTRKRRAPRVTLRVSHRLDRSRYDFVFVRRNGRDVGLATSWPHNAESACVGSHGAAPAVDWRWLSGDAHLGSTALLRFAVASLPEYFLSGQNVCAGSGRREYLGVS